jgi:hypothetical protein
MMASLGVYFIAFASDNRLVTISDAVEFGTFRLDAELRTLPSSMPALTGFNGSMAA